MFSCLLKIYLLFLIWRNVFLCMYVGTYTTCMFGVCGVSEKIRKMVYGLKVDLKTLKSFFF